MDTCRFLFFCTYILTEGTYNVCGKEEHTKHSYTDNFVAFAEVLVVFFGPLGSQRRQLIGRRGKIIIHRLLEVQLKYGYKCGPRAGRELNGIKIDRNCAMYIRTSRTDIITK